MIQRLFGFLVVLASLGFGTLSAQAKVPIPCTSDKIVKVADLPRTSEFKLPSGQQIDLGYIYQGCFSGKWVGYVGVSNRYMSWKDGMLPDVVAASGMKALPEAPGLVRGLIGSPGQFWVEWLYIVVITGVIIGTLLSNVAKSASAAEDVGQNVRTPETDSSARPGVEAAPKAGFATSRSASAPSRAGAPAFGRRS